MNEERKKINIDKYELIIFDLDGTLAPPKSPMNPDMAELFAKLITKKKVAVISGGGYSQFEIQFLHSLPFNQQYMSNLLLLPTSGTRLYTWRGAWCEQYAEHLTPKEKEKIMEALNTALKMSGFLPSEKTYGPPIEDRGSQVTFSALGQQAPLELKRKWDPDLSKRRKIIEILHKKIPEYDTRIGGTTSIDVTKRGVNKGYGIRKLEHFLKIPPEKILFVGDALFHGGNDYPAKAAGVDTLAVKDENETKEQIRLWVEDVHNSPLQKTQNVLDLHTSPDLVK